MFRKAFLFGGLLLLAGAAVLVTPGSGQAQHRGGGGHHGGFNHGGGHHGGFHHGGFHHGGFHHGGFHHGGFNHGGFHHGGFRHFGGLWWYPGYYGNYGASPYYSGFYPYSGYSDYYPYTYSSDWSSPGYDSGYYGYYGDPTSSYLNSDISGTAQPDTSALVTVSVPANAEIWFEGNKMTSTGSVREYQSPPLTPGSRYTYEVRARWKENGQEVTQTQQVEVTAGTRVNVQFPERLQPTKARTTPSD
jgi:uncharacterized protein (TIGR03000 family)